MVRFASAEIEFFAHATENESKILSAVSNSLAVDADAFNMEVVDGHFGNKIARYKAAINGKRATEIAEKITSMLDEPDRMFVYENFDMYIDSKNHLYLRISKQGILYGKIFLEQKDPIKIKLKMQKKFRSGNELEEYRKALIRGNENEG